MIFKIMLEICIKEKISITSKKINKIITKSNCMINQSIWNLELYKNNFNYDENWNKLLVELVDNMFRIIKYDDERI